MAHTIHLEKLTLEAWLSEFRNLKTIKEPLINNMAISFYDNSIEHGCKEANFANAHSLVYEDIKHILDRFVLYEYQNLPNGAKTSYLRARTLAYSLFFDILSNKNTSPSLMSARTMISQMLEIQSLRDCLKVFPEFDD